MSDYFGKTGGAFAARVLTPDQLSNSARNQAESFIKLAEQPGVFVGALLGSLPWDVKPLLLQSGTLSLLRFSSPEASGSQDAAGAWNKLFAQLANLHNYGDDFACGERNGRFWLKRPFFQRTLAEIVSVHEEELGVDPIEVAQQLIRQLMVWKRDHFAHGHLCPSNLAIEENSPIILDYGFCALSPELKRECPDIAPELKEGSSIRHQADIFGLGLLLQKLMYNFLSDEHAKLIESMLLPDPSKRPRVEVVMEVLFPGVKLGVSQVSPGSVPRAENIKLGRALGSNLEVRSASAPQAEDKEGGDITDEAGQVETENQQPASETKEEISRSVEETLEWLSGTSVLGRDIVDQIRLLVTAENDTKVKESAEKGSEHLDHLKAARGEKDDRLEVLLDQESIADDQESDQTFIVDTKPQTESSSSWMLLIVVGVLILGIVGYKKGYFGDGAQSSNQMPRMPYSDYWESNLPSRMKKVALAAIQNEDEQAEIAIIRDVLSGVKRPGVRVDFLQVAFDSRWEKELTIADRQIALTLGLVDLVKGSVKSFPPLEKAHPGILFAVVGSLPPDDNGRLVAKVPIKSMSSLPAPIGPAFGVLEQLKISSFADPTARALAQLLYGQNSLRVLQKYIGADNDLVIAKEKLGLLLALPDKSAKRIDDLVTIINMNKSGALKGLLAWFDLGKYAHWEGVSNESKILLMSGRFPKEKLPPENYADLLNFPVIEVRDGAHRKLKSLYPKSEHRTLAVLAGSRNRLHRDMTIKLLALMLVDRKTQFSLLSRWFKKDPDPDTVVEIIVSRSGLKQDLLSIEGSRYLKKRKWSASALNLKRLLNHSEALVRALAYSKLDSKNPKHIAILKLRATGEPVEVLRKHIRAKLAEAGVKVEG